MNCPLLGNKMNKTSFQAEITSNNICKVFRSSELSTVHSVTLQTEYGWSTRKKNNYWNTKKEVKSAIENNLWKRSCTMPWRHRQPLKIVNIKKTSIHETIGTYQVRVQNNEKWAIFPVGVAPALPLSSIQGHHTGDLHILTFSLLLQSSHDHTNMLWFLPVWKTIHLNTASTSKQLLLRRKKKRKIPGQKVVCM